MRRLAWLAALVLATCVAAHGRAVAAAPAAGTQGAPRLTAGGPHITRVHPGNAARIEAAGSRIEMEPGSVEAITDIEVIPLAARDLATLDQGMSLVTAGGGGYRFGPHGSRFRKPLTLVLPYDPQRLPAGTTEDDVHAFYFDEDLERWIALNRVSVDPATHTVVSLTDHFTDIITATLVTPAHPEIESFVPTMMKDMKAADPGSGIDLIQPPEANPLGEARLTFPIEVPPGRNRLHPSLALSYSSGAGNGWLGVGWALQLPDVVVETRWGVPRYGMLPDAGGTIAYRNQETESYLMNGVALTPLAHRSAFEDRIGDHKVFRARVEGAFDEIVRHGDGPATFWWEVYDRNGVRSTYGEPLEAGPTAGTLRDAAGNIFRWALREVRDPRGNAMRFEYERVSDPGVEHGSVAGEQLYLSAINYTGRAAEGGAYQPGAYTVRFIRDSDPSLAPWVRRSDVQIDCRGGFKQVTAELLRQIRVEMDGSLVRQYDLEYEEGAFGKARLAAIHLRGADGLVVPGAEHRFAYHDEVRNAAGTYASGFESETPWSVPFDDVTLCSDVGPLGICPSANFEGFDRASAMSGAITHGFGGHLYLGLACAVPSKRFSAGLKVGFDRSSTDAHLALLDVTGDNLPDKVFRSGSGFVYRENLARPGGSTAFSGAALPLPSLEAISTETFTSMNGGLEGYYGIGVWANASTGISVGRVYSTDANGDGFLDIVNRGEILFGRSGPDGAPRFEATSAGTPVPLATGALDGEGLIQDYESLFQEQIDQHPLQDVFRRWWAPYDGFVRIQGGVRLEVPTESADGVRVSIQHNGTVLWSARITAGDAQTHGPQGLERVRVTRGDRLYFRVHSVFDGSMDAVAWDPEIEYLDVVPALDANQFDAYRYRALEDFVLVGRAARATVSHAGQVRVVGVFEKRDTTSDDVAVSVRRNDVEMFRATMPWDSTGQIVLDVPFSVAADDTATHEVNEADNVYVQLIADSPIDPRRIGWRADAPPELTYEAVVGAPTKTLRGDPLVRTFLPYDLDLYPADTLVVPQEAWEAPNGGTISVTTALDGEWTFRDLSVEDPVPNGALAFTVKRRGSRLAHATIAVQDRIAKNVTVDNITVAQGDRIFFDVSMRNASARGRVAARVRYVPFQLPAVEVPCVLHTNIDFDDVPMLGRGLYPQPHRGWSGAAYNGNPAPDDPERPHACSGSREGSTAAIVESDLVIEESLVGFLVSKDYAGLKRAIETQKAYAYSPVHEVLDDGSLRASWRGNDESGWIQAGSVSATRHGADLVGVPCASDLGGPGDSRGIPRIGTSINGGGGVGIPPLSVSGSVGHSRSETDFMDLNGDRFPDIVGLGRAQFTLPNGGLELRNRTLGFSFLEAHRSSNNRAGSIGATLPVTWGGSRGTDGANNSSGPKGERTRNLMVGLGFSGDLSAGRSTVQADLIDVNGDGLPDRVFVDGTVGLNLGYGFADAEAWPGLPGLEQTHNCEGSLGVGLGFNDGIYGIAGGLSYSQSRSRTHRSLLDLNGDGLADLLRHERDTCLIDAGKTRLWVAFNTGNGFAAETPWEGAGLEAIAKTVSASLGGGLFFSLAIPVFMCSPVTPIYLIINPGGALSTGMSRQELALLDVDGDGCADMVRSARDDELIVARNRTGRTNLLQRVDRPLGGSFTLDYERQGNTTDLPQTTWALSRVELFDGITDDGPSPLLTTFAYQSPRYDRGEREFYGFGEVIEQHRAADVPGQVYREVARTYLNGSYYSKGLLTHEETRDAARRPMRAAAFDYAFRDIASPLPADLGSRTAAIVPTMSREARHLGEGAVGAGVGSRRLYTYDESGNVVRIVDEGDAGSDDDVDATITYAACPGGRVRSRPTGIVIRNGQATLAERQATLDCATGDVLQVRERLADGTEAVTDLTYTSSGALESVVGPANLQGQRYTLRYDYDARLSTYVTRVEDSFGLTSYATHDPRFGRPESTTDANGYVITYAHDALGRITSVTGPYEQGLGVPTLTFEYHPEAPVPWARTRHHDALRKDPIETVLFADGLGRMLQTKVDGTVHTAPETPAEDVMIVSGRRRYDAFGRTVEEYQSVTEPLGQGPLFNPTFDAMVPSRTVYDALDRPTAITAPDQTATFYRHALAVDRDGGLRRETTVIDANGRERRLYRDARERLVSVREGSAEAIWTSYRYDAMDRLVSIMDARGHMTRMEYDALGRRTALVRPDAGTTRYEYDAAGNLVALRTANLLARGKAIRYEHEFSRLRAVRYPNPARDVTYEYGGPHAPANGAGRVIRITDEGGLEERAYGRLGELVQVSRRFGEDEDDDKGDDGDPRTSPRTYTTQYRYDTWGRMLGIVYPDGEDVAYEYDSGGLVRHVTGTGPQGTYEYLRRLEYDASLLQAYLELGNGVSTRFTYRPEDERLDRMESRTAAGVFQSLRFDYDPVGNVRSVANEVPVSARGPGGPTLQQFTYDELYRLTRATGVFRPARGGSDEYTLELSYDAIHNIREKRQRHERVKASGRRTLQRATSYHDLYRYSVTQPHAAIEVGDREYTYDANGNQTGWEDEERGGHRRNAWDEENRLRSVSGRGPDVRFTYDAAGTRLLKRRPGGEITYVNQFFTVKNDRIATRHIYVGTTRLASRVIRPRDSDDDDSHASGRDLYFYHPDHLGSTQFVTDANGEVTQHLEYFPFGEIWVDERKGSARSELAFSGRELDEETGLYYFGARYQDPRLGQFLSVDPTSSGSGAQLADAVPAALNSYAYAFNNPVRLVVPGGLRPEWWSALSQTLGRFSGAAGPSVPSGIPMMPPEIKTSDSPVHASSVAKVNDILDPMSRRSNDPESQTRARSNAMAFSTRERSNAFSGGSRPRANALPVQTRERSNAVFGEGPSAYLDGPAPVVLGENMAGRVTPYARGIGAETIVDWLGGRQWTQQLNDAYIGFIKSDARRAIDIGPDFGRRLQFKLNPPKDRSARPVYESERQNLLQGGATPNYNAIFERTGKFEGGVRGFDIVGRREGGAVGLN